jgi:hypothetical protein
MYNLKVLHLWYVLPRLWYYLPQHKFRGVRIFFSAALAECASLFTFTPQIIVRINNHCSKRCQGGIESVGYIPEAVNNLEFELELLRHTRKPKTLNPWL